jgi:hypothetical protein
MSSRGEYREKARGEFFKICQAPPPTGNIGCRSDRKYDKDTKKREKKYK